MHDGQFPDGLWLADFLAAVIPKEYI